MPTDGYVHTQDGVRLYLQTRGSSAPFLVVPNGFHLLADFEHLARDRSMVVYDLRNRGRSDEDTDEATRVRGVHNDVDDLEAVRRHFRADAVDLLGHSYVGTIVALYAMKHPTRVRRVVQIGPMPPSAAAKYPPHLTGADAIQATVLTELAQIQKERPGMDPTEFCRRFWSILRAIYVADPADACKIRWDRCDLPNERNFMRYWNGSVFPSLQALALTRHALSPATMPALVIHGRRDRSAPYGGGRDWALLWPDARLVSVDNAAHAPWIEAPDLVLGSIETFLGGAWPDAALKVKSL